MIRLEDKGKDRNEDKDCSLSCILLKQWGDWKIKIKMEIKIVV